MMVLRARPLRTLAAVLAISAASGTLTPPCRAAERAHPAQSAGIEALIFRIFLRDGSTLVSYGDFARVADRVVFSIPLGAIDGPAPPLHLVSIAESAVDWERTDRYAEAMRARHYAATGGETDFDALSAEVAKALNDVAFTKDPARRLALATAARRRLAEWPAAHHGYRADDVAQLAALMDEALGDLRVAAGMTRFDLSLVATATYRPPDETELPAPSARESVDQAFAAASVAADPTERVSLLQAVMDSLGGSSATDAPWAAALRAKAAATLSAEAKIDQDYRTLVNKTIAAADVHAKRANVKGIETLLHSVLEADDKLGRRRPDTTAALLATLDTRLDSVRRLRLARDAWATRRDAIVQYQRRLRPIIDTFRRSINALEQIRQLSGPRPNALQPLAIRLTDASREMKGVRAPA
ncbi:MAG TPA: hypothetical protein VFJ02_07520, partial [Vicinamibacterales bacterium]|nr:hypothetical protein [Vicinamibacterales bacterium]